jgi:HAD superfamily phosphatase (TIGR01681 family)
MINNASVYKEHTIKLAVFDLDDTLIHEGFADSEPILCNDTMAILELLKKNNIKIALASHNHNAETIMKNAGIYNFFDFVQAYYDFTDKASHIHNIMEHFSFFNIKLDEMVFYDDMKINIIKARINGINAKLVSHKTGITLDDVITTIPYLFVKTEIIQDANKEENKKIDN